MKNKINNSSVFQYHLSDFYNKNFKLINTIIIVFLLFIISVLFTQKENVVASKNIPKNEPSDTNLNIKGTAKPNAKIVVYISGEVNKPDVYEIEENKRIDDLVELAGGFTETAYIENINLAQKLFDEDHIHIQNINDILQEEEKQIQESSNKININTAGKLELTQIKGVGDATADSIVKYREEIGKFKTIEDIMNISGIGEKTFEKIKDDITVR